MIANIVVFFVTILPEFIDGNWLAALLGVSNPASLEDAVWSYGMIPYFVLRGERLFTLFTSLFLHANIFHLGGNMLFLYIFGDNVEDAFGRGRYVFFYLVSGIAASALFILTQLLSSDPIALLRPTIGASGAIAGVLGAYMILYPNARILTLVLLFFVNIVAVPAVFFLIVWFLYQLLYGLLALGFEAVTGIAYWAHIGGFVVGIFFGLVWRGRRRIRTV